MRILSFLGVGAVLAALSLAADRPARAASPACPAPVARCPETGGCPPAIIAERGTEIDAKTGRRFFLDAPCDLKPGEPVVFILAIHGAGSIGNWNRHYFPAVDYKDKHRLVIATPTATDAPLRVWTPGDDAHLQNIAEMVFERFGRANVRSFWLAGHSQGGATSNRIVCNPYFGSRVDGWLSLSGGRIGAAQVAPGFGPPPPPGQAPGAPPAGARPGIADTPACDISFIFATGEHEIAALPQVSPWAEKYGCKARVRRPDVADTRPGYVWDAGRAATASPAWGRTARPGVAEVMVYPDCKGGRLVADVVRRDKGHTEGLEPRITEALVQMMISSPGRKAQGG